MKQGLGDLHPPPQAAGELLRPLLPPLGEAEALQGGGDTALQLPAGEAVEVALVDEVLAHAELDVEARALEDDAEPPAHLPRLGGEIGAEHPHGAGLRPGEGGEDAEQGRLATAVRSQEAEDAPRGHVEIQAGERGPGGTGLAFAGVGVPEAPGLDGRSLGGHRRGQETTRSSSMISNRAGKYRSEASIRRRAPGFVRAWAKAKENPR